ncbi:polysaccharide pyruvyl transferase family protein [Sphingobium sp.]|uniref:polysaccharide pyruvyl transferase family protein n=1 Tax=Sphingobium sp. TaxID=1912891 RepID=UPI002BC7B326|nr:polysaccharide pyruvyl transferase family protein [Sphingobium sp.]HUD95314.1 polysaccharide pyruvyl transferase family protein [Sphingobium sp.]
MHGQASSTVRRDRFGILTFHRCINYGSYWQARCLVEGLRSIGADAVLLDHASVAIERAELRCAFRPTLPMRTPRSDFPAYARKTRTFRQAFAQLPLSPAFPLDQPETMEDYDAVIVGSDEVWNLQHPWYGGCETFYGQGIAARLVAYAASFGNQNAAWGLSDHWARRLRNFSALSVRDDNSRSIIKAALGHEPALVLDPCLQFPPPTRARASEDRPYVAVYGHGFPDWLARYVRRWADGNNYRLLSIGYRNDWADEQRIDAGPEEFAELIARAQAVVTNFFHGCVFALLNRQPFVTAPSAYRFNKVRDLMALLGTQERMVTEGTSDRDFSRLLDAPIDECAEARIVARRTQSDRYIRQALALRS